MWVWGFFVGFLGVGWFVDWLGFLRDFFFFQMREENAFLVNLCGFPLLSLGVPWQEGLSHL